MSLDAMNVPSVVLEDVHLTLTAGSGPVNILNGVSLTVGQGETLAVVGPSGSGKTTMLMLLAGLERPTSGAVRMAGKDLTAMGEDELARFRRENLGIVFQAFHLIPTMTALENAALPLEFAHHPDARRQALDALEQVGLGHRAGHYPSQLSGGEQQRVALARAFAPRPRIILADEPTGNLDEGTGARVMELLFKMQAEEKATLVLVTHDRNLAGRCGRTASMHSGRMEER
ncbi:ABC transporter ATP-binding protein [Desulfomicrobium escambiense]|uniref:ABC transporter ATP-binding protein n=1 Tax=Desulfomicrobium escambiense TaxID=29503 RepID=UPI001FE03E7E|nr:ABC transporter ATP-binding protein [Desulfomicrobium escambiense]